MLAYANTLAYRVKDLNAGPGDGLPERLKPHFYLHALGSTLFLRADDGVGGPALWRSDGTEAGTRLVKDFTPDAEDGLGDEPAVLDGAMYFFAGTGSDLGLWKMTESAEGPSLVRPLSPRGQGPTHYLRAFGAHLSFVHTAAETGTEPWISDGTADGTRLLADIRPGAESSDPRFFRVLGDTLTFAASDGVHGNELWRSDVAGGAVQVLDIHPTGDGLRQFESNNEAIGGTLYFSADDGVHDAELWSSDGTAEGTRLFKDLWPGGPGTSQNSAPGDFTQVGSTVFFTAWNDGFGRELWKTDGTPEGTVRLQELRQGSPGEALGGLVALNGRLVFIARGTYPH
ncbi:MAG TPA: ELWxxDGT repeat protein, partial [Aggregicoccus sp.]|nr:ELWxxDGT repeat protein [Aggregicoccus sp.]